MDRDPYLMIRNAMMWTELIVCQSNEDEPETAWDLMMQSKVTLSPAEVVDLIRRTVDDVINDPLSQVSKEVVCEVRREMDHPDYVTYIDGKMGAV